MSFNKKTWKNRISETPGRRKLTNVSTGAQTIYDVARQEGTITQNGDDFSAENMNDLETRIKTAIDTIETNFQVGVDLIYDACVDQGVTPSASTPQAIATAIGSISKSWSHTLDIDVDSYSRAGLPQPATIQYGLSNVVSGSINNYTGPAFTITYYNTSGTSVGTANVPASTASVTLTIPSIVVYMEMSGDSGIHCKLTLNYQT